MKIIAIDPGNKESAWLRLECFQYGGDRIIDFGKHPNEDILSILATTYAEHLAIEMVQSFGMAVGASVFDTVFWAGRFAQMWRDKPGKFSLVYRKDVKLHLCNSMRAKDGNIRQALIDRFSRLIRLSFGSFNQGWISNLNHQSSFAISISDNIIKTQKHPSFIILRITEDGRLSGSEKPKIGYLSTCYPHFQYTTTALKQIVLSANSRLRSGPIRTLSLV